MGLKLYNVEQSFLRFNNYNMWGFPKMNILLVILSYNNLLQTRSNFLIITVIGKMGASFQIFFLNLRISKIYFSKNALGKIYAKLIILT